MEPFVFGFDQIQVQIAFQLLNISVLALLLTLILYKPVKKILADREARIKNQLQAIENDKTEAAQLKTQYEQIMKDVEAEKNDILEAARKLAVAKGAEQEEVARNEANTIKTRALREIEAEQNRIKDEMKKSVINVSSVIAAKFLTKPIDAETHERLFKETLEGVEGDRLRTYFSTN